MSSKPPVKLYWSGGKSGDVNFGDALSRDVVRILSGRAVIYRPPSEADLCAIGSVLERASKHAWKRPLKGLLSRLIVWGTGTMFDGQAGWNPFLDIRAVRGPLTLAQLKPGCDLALGDPGLLCDLLLDNKAVEPTHAIGIIPHVADFHDPQVAELANRIPNSTIIDLACPEIAKTTTLIACCEGVVSSSLHGLIAADALGIPRVRVRFSNRIEGGDHKFNDYDLSVGLSKFTCVDPMTLNSMTVQHYLEAPAGAAISKLKRQLITSFVGIGL